MSQSAGFHFQQEISAMTDDLSNRNRKQIENLIRRKLVELIELGMEHGIPVHRLMSEALDTVDFESG